ARSGGSARTAAGSHTHTTSGNALTAPPGAISAAARNADPHAAIPHSPRLLANGAAKVAAVRTTAPIQTSEFAASWSVSTAKATRGDEVACTPSDSPVRMPA